MELRRAVSKERRNQEEMHNTTLKYAEISKCEAGTEEDRVRSSVAPATFPLRTRGPTESSGTTRQETPLHATSVAIHILSSTQLSRTAAKCNVDEVLVCQLASTSCDIHVVGGRTSSRGGNSEVRRQDRSIQSIGNRLMWAHSATQGLV